MNPVRPVTFHVRAGSAGRKARTSAIDAVMVVRKNVRSHPCQLVRRQPSLSDRSSSDFFNGIRPNLGHLNCFGKR